MRTNEKKVDKYERKLYRMVTGGRYGDYLTSPASMQYSTLNDEETENIWEEVRAQLNKTTGNKYTPEVKEKMITLIRSRLAYLRGNCYNFISVEEKKKYVGNIDNYSKFFSEKTIKAALKQVDIREFIEKKEAYGGIEDYYKKRGYYELEKCSREVAEKDSRGRATGRTVREQGTIYLIPSSNQVKEANFLKFCVEMEYPYAKKYAFTYYPLDSVAELYLNVRGEGNLYVPLECFKTHSIQPAIDRMTSYFTWYYKDKRELKKNLDLMGTAVFRRLKRDIEKK